MTSGGGDEMTVDTATVFELAAQMQSVAEQELYGQQGWKATPAGRGSMRFVRHGRVRVLAAWIGGDMWVLAWEYTDDDWRAETHPADEIVMQVDMTLNAMAE